MGIYIEHFRQGAVSGCGPIRSTHNCWVNKRPLWCWVRVPIVDGPSILIEPLRPCDLHEGDPLRKFSRDTVENIVKAISIGHRDKLPLLVVHGCVEEHGSLGR